MNRHCPLCNSKDINDIETIYVAKFPICMCYMFFSRKHWKTIIVDCFSPLPYSIGLLYGFAKIKWRT